MKKISTYTAAAILILSRLYAYALYVPPENESAAATLVCCLILNAVKLLLLIPLVRLIEKNKEQYGNIASAVLFAVSFTALITSGYGFINLCSSVYHDRFSTLGIRIIWFAVCAYTASMGLTGVSRASEFMVFAFTGVILLTFIGMRHYMLPDRPIQNAISYEEIADGIKRMLPQLFDIPILIGLIPHIKARPDKCTELYITFDSIICTIVFLMYNAVLGDFHSKAGYPIFTLFSCTEGTIIDRADGVFIAITCACGMVTAAVLLIIISDCVKKIIKKENANTIVSAAAALSTLMLICL